MVLEFASYCPPSETVVKYKCSNVVCTWDSIVEESLNFKNLNEGRYGTNVNNNNHKYWIENGKKTFLCAIIIQISWQFSLSCRQKRKQFMCFYFCSIFIVCMKETKNFNKNVELFLPTNANMSAFFCEQNLNVRHSVCTALSGFHSDFQHQGVK